MVLFKKTFILFFLFLHLLCNSKHSISDELTINVPEGDYMPYARVTASTAEGVYIDTIAEAAYELGYKISFKPLPWKRAIIEARTGKSDAMVPISKTLERIRDFSFTTTHITSEETVLFSRNYFDYDGDLKSLRRYKIGFQIGKFNRERLKSIPSNNLYEVRNTEKLIRMLHFGRIDLFIGTNFQVQYVKRKKGISGTVMPVYPAISIDKGYIAFSRKNIKSEELAKQFSKSILNLKSNGRYEQIISKYIYE